jgi:poly(glycerol-phosphate) alpha-glucosyltransferase
MATKFYLDLSKKFSSSIKIAMLCSSVSRQAGGLFNSIRLLSSSLANLGQDIYVLSGKDLFTNKDIKLWPSKITYAIHEKVKPDFFGFQIGIFRSLRKFNPEIIHLHGIWMYPAFVTFVWKKIANKVLIISPRGMLDPWAVKNSRFKKIIAEIFYAKNNLKSADCIHALNFEEYKSIRLYGLRNPVAIIPNAINLPIISKNSRKKTDREKIKTLLFIGRIHPKKGLANLIKAWKILDDKNQINNWNLHIGGWSQLNHEDYLKAEVRKLN